MYSWAWTRASFFLSFWPLMRPLGFEFSKPAHRRFSEVFLRVRLWFYGVQLQFESVAAETFSRKISFSSSSFFSRAMRFPKLTYFLIQIGNDTFIILLQQLLPLKSCHLFPINFQKSFHKFPPCLILIIHVTTQADLCGYVTGNILQIIDELKSTDI